MRAAGSSKTDASGDSVSDRPVEVNGLFQTFCTALKINAKKEADHDKHNQ
jgi:hypothetical protein